MYILADSFCQSRVSIISVVLHIALEPLFSLLFFFAELSEFTTLAGDDFAERQGGAYTPEGDTGEPDDDAIVGIATDGVKARSRLTKPRKIVSRFIIVVILW